MKRTFIFALAAVMLLAGCAKSEPAATAPQILTTEAPAAAVTEESAETTAATEETASWIEEDDDDVDMIPSTDELKYYEYQVFATRELDTSEIKFLESEAIKEDNGTVRFDYAYCYRTTGVFDDSETNPDNFDEYEYKGVIYDPEGYVAAYAGGEHYGMKIRYADTIFCDNILMSSRVEYDGEIEMTGYLQYFYDEDYTISSGDLIFIPDTFGGYYVPVYGYNARVRKLTKADGTEFSIISELPTGLRTGNLLSGQNSLIGITEDSEINICPEALSQLDDMFGSARSNTVERVKVTLSDVTFEWSDQFGMGHSFAIIRNVEKV